MSEVTNVILSADKQYIGEVNRFFEEKGVPGLVSIHEPSQSRGRIWYGGTKGFEADLFVGAFNYLDLRGFYNHLRTISWRRPECVQLIVKEQEDFVFRVIQVFPEAFAKEEEEQSLTALQLGGVPGPTQPARP